MKTRVKDKIRAVIYFRKKNSGFELRYRNLITKHSLLLFNYILHPLPHSAYLLLGSSLSGLFNLVSVSHEMHRRISFLK